MSSKRKEEEERKKKKKKDNWLANEIMTIMEKSMKAALDKAIDDMFKDWL